MLKVRIKQILCILIPILLLAGGWEVFNTYIRPNHYQLLFPYSVFHAKHLAVTETRLGGDDQLQILIPAGKAIVGKDEYEAEIELDDFWIDQRPVTVANYKAFLAETNMTPPRYRNEYEKYYLEKKYELLPIVFVSWGQAEDYCEYYGGHLATEAQWEKAARGSEGAILFFDDEAKDFASANYDWFYGGATFSGWLPKGHTGFGLLDMSGNVREWILDLLLADGQEVRTDDWQTIRDMETDDPSRMLKGGAFSDDVSHLRLNTRDSHPVYSPGVNRGFRCVYEVSE